jgi:uncharacterized membrane protein (DUF106 family)
VTLLDETVKNKQREMQMVRMKSTVFVGVILIGTFGLLNHLYEGQPVARLPFEPFSLLRSISHRGLSGNDFYQCSMTFLYVLCSVGIRANITKYLGFTPANQGGPSMWEPPKQS